MLPNQEQVAEALKSASGIAWDTCHKIYILMDETQMDLMQEYGYPQIASATANSQEDLLTRLDEWYEESCSLRFIDSVSTVDGDPNFGFRAIVPQFFGEDEE